MDHKVITFANPQHWFWISLLYMACFGLFWSLDYKLSYWSFGIDPTASILFWLWGLSHAPNLVQEVQRSMFSKQGWWEQLHAQHLVSIAHKKCSKISQSVLLVILLRAISCAYGSWYCCFFWEGVSYRGWGWVWPSNMLCSNVYGERCCFCCFSVIAAVAVVVLSICTVRVVVLHLY